MTATRLVVSDVDGTLVDKQKRLTQATVDAVGRLRDAGIGFTIISARPCSGMMPIVRALGIDGSMGAYNGGTLFRADGTMTQQFRVPEDVVVGILALAQDSGASVWVFADDRWHASDLANAHVASERITADQEPIVTRDFADLASRVDKMTFVSDTPGVLPTLLARAQEAFGGRATIAQSQTYYLDVTALAANKGDGLAALAHAAGVPLDAVTVIGDMYNDLPMFARAGRAIAMGQAPADVRAAAAETTTANDQDGVAHAIDTLILPLHKDAA